MNPRFLIVPLFCLSLGACFDQDPKSFMLPAKISHMSEGDAGVKKAIQSLDEADQALLKAYLMRAAMDQGSGKLAEKSISIGDAIKTQAEWIEDQATQEKKKKDSADELAKIKSNVLKLMETAVTINTTSFSFGQQNLKNNKKLGYFEIGVKIKNNSDKTLTGLIGVIQIDDLSGAILKRIEISIPKEIQASESLSYIFRTDYNQLMDDDVKLAATESSKLLFEWYPETFIYSDGSKLEMPK